MGMGEVSGEPESGRHTMKESRFHETPQTLAENRQLVSGAMLVMVTVTGYCTTYISFATLIM